MSSGSEIVEVPKKEEKKSQNNLNQIPVNVPVGMEKYVRPQNDMLKISHWENPNRKNFLNWFDNTFKKYRVKRGEKIEVDMDNNLDEKESILLTGLPLQTDYSDSALVAMTKDFQKWKKIRMIGSAAMASAYVASGKADMYKESGAFLWDVAAGAAIINAANGEALITNQKDNYQVDVAFTNKNLNR